MDRKLCISALLLGLFVVSLLVGEETKSASVEKNDSYAPVDRNGLVAYFFYGKGCPHCAKVEPFLAEMEQKYPLQLHKYDIYSNRSCLSLFDEYSDKHGLSLERRGVPTVFVSGTYFVGDTPILDGFEEVVRRSLEEKSSVDSPLEAESSSADQVFEVESPESLPQETISKAGGVSIVTITVAALVDAVSPCSIAILVFLIGARVLVANRRKRALKVGLAFCLSVFIAYFLFGLGLLTVVQVSGFSGIFSLLVALVAVLAGFFYLKDVFWHGRGGFVMEVPRSLKPLLMKMLKGVTSPFGAFLMGFAVSLFELPCTGGPYLLVLGQLADSATRLQAIPLLLYYNFIFVLPLIIISMLLYSNIFSISKVREWNERNKRLLRLVGGFAIMALGFLVIPVSQMFQFVQLILRCLKVIGLPVLVIIFLHYFASFAKPRKLGSRFMRVPGRGILLLSLIVMPVFIVPNLANLSTGQSIVVSATESAESEVEDDGNDGIPLLPHCLYLRERPDFDITNADECTIPRLTLTLHCYEYIATGGALASYALASQLLWNFLLQFGDTTVDSKYFEKDPAVENAKNTVYYTYTKPKIDEMMENMNCGESKSDVVYIEQSIEPSDPKLFYAVNIFDLYSKHEISVTKNCDKCEEYGEVRIHSTWTVRDRYDWHPGEYAGDVYDDWAKFLHNCNWAKEFDVTSEWSEDKSEEILTQLEICTDDDPCTMDLCDPDKGCIYRPIAGCDHPDDNFDVSTSKTDSNSMLNPETRPNIAILKVGNAYSTQEFLASFNEHSVLVEIDFSSDLVKDYPVLIIPSGGLYGLDSLLSFKSNLEEYVKNGGSLIVLSQQHGYEFNALPSGEVSGFGWLEDQSCHYQSVGISTYHLMLSGQDSVICDVNVDGYFTRYPENATVLLSRTKNGMPAMIMYNYGKGTVIATTAYTDWAYDRGHATRDGINLMRDVISWAKDPREIPQFGTSDIVDISVNVTNVYLPEPLPPGYPQFELGETVNLSINVTNYYNTASDKIAFEVIDPDFKIVYVNVSVSVLPNETKTIDFTYETTISSKGGIYYVFYSLYTNETVIWGGVGEEFALGIDRLELTYEVGFTLRDPDRDILKQEDISVSVPTGETEVVNFTHENPSKLGIWNLEYKILDYNDTLIDFGTKRFAVSRYAENPEGFVYQGEEISFAVSSPEERYAYGSDVPFTIHIWNRGDTNRSILVKIYYDRMKSVDEILHVPTQGEATYTHTVHDVFAHRLIIRVGFYEDNEYLGRAEIMVRMFTPSINIQVETDQKECVRGEDVFVLLDLTNKQSASCNATIMVRTLDPDNNKVFEDTFNVNLSANESSIKTLSFPLPITSESGTYLVSAEAYTDGKKIGSGSTYFEVLKDSIIRVSFDKLNRAYRIREDMSIDLEITNIGSALWSSAINISIPVLAFEDSRYVSLDLNQTEKINYNLNIPETTPAGKHDVIVTIEFDDSVKKYYFVIPHSNVVINYDRSSYNAGEDLRSNLTNIGGVDAVGTLITRLYDWRWVQMDEKTINITVRAGKSTVVDFRLLSNLVSGNYILTANWEDVSGGAAYTEKAFTLSGLSAYISAETDRQFYLKGMEPNASTTIVNKDGAIVNATLIQRLYTSLPTRIVGVDVGDWFKYGDISVNWSSNDPSATCPRELRELNATEWLMMSATNVYGTILTLQGIVHLKDGTEFTTRGYVDIDTGDGIRTIWAISADLEENDTLYTSGHWLNMRINETVVRTYPYGDRDTSHITVTLEDSWTIDETEYYYYYSENYYWDRSTGILVEASMEEIAQVGEYLTTWSMSFKIAESNVWVVSEGPTSSSTGYSELGEIDPGVSFEAVFGRLIWERRTEMNIDAGSTVELTTQLPTLTRVGKHILVTRLESSLGQPIAINTTSFYVIDKNLTVTVDTAKSFYKTGEPVTIFGRVYNFDYLLSATGSLTIYANRTEIHSEILSVEANSSTPYSYSTSFGKVGTYRITAKVDGYEAVTFISVIEPSVDVSLTAPDVVGRDPFEASILLVNPHPVELSLTVTLHNVRTWEVSLPPQSLEILNATMSVNETTELVVTVTGEVFSTVNKSVVLGENAKIDVTPENTYLEGTVVVPFTVTNIGLLDVEFNATFSLHGQTVSKIFYLPESQDITDGVSFNLTRGKYLLKYTSPFEDGSVIINVLSPPEFVVSSVTSIPVNMTFTIGQNATIVFKVKNIGGLEGEANIRLMMPDFEDSNSTWIRPGAVEEISFSFIIPDDLEEKYYKGIYELNGKKGEIRFFVQGAKIAVSASLDKPFYVEGETATLTLNVMNERNLDLSLFSRVKFNGYDSTVHCNLTGLSSKSLNFSFPVRFTGAKILYTIYASSGRALYINAMYIYEKTPETSGMTLSMDKQVYSIGDTAAIFVDVTRSGTLTLTAPNYTETALVEETATFRFIIPELRSGTYYVDYTFNNYSSSYPFDVIGYSARIVEFTLDKEEYKPSDIVTMEMTVEVNRAFSGSLSVWIYDPMENIVDSFEIDKTFTEGENKIEISRTLTSRELGIHAMVCGVYANLTEHSLVLLASGARYFDVHVTIIHEVEVAIDPHEASVQPGSSVQYKISIHNMGSVEDTYELTLQGLDTNLFSLSQTSITLAAGQTEQVTLTISPPHEALNLEDYIFSVTSTSQADPTVSDSADATVTVDFTPTLPPLPEGGLAVAIQPKLTTITAGSIFVLDILIINNENFDDVIDLNINLNGIPPAYQANLSWMNWTSLRVFIPVASSFTARLEVTIPEGIPTAYKIFKIPASSESWTNGYAQDMGVIKVID